MDVTSDSRLVLVISALVSELKGSFCSINVLIPAL